MADSYRFWLFLLLLLPVAPLQAAPNCTIMPLKKARISSSTPLTQANWLAPENLRIGQQSASLFVSVNRIESGVSAESLQMGARPLVLRKINADDPLDSKPRNLDFLLDSRLYADGLIVLHNGKVIAERYWHDLEPQQPRLLMGATRPILSTLGSIAVSQGKLAPDRSIVRYVKGVSDQTGLRKLSIQRMLDAESRFDWTSQELENWMKTSGWLAPPSNAAGLRSWLEAPNRWNRDMTHSGLSAHHTAPDDDLMTWLLSDLYRMPVSKVFCDQLLTRLRPENDILWATDSRGTELGGGLAMTLRDFARFGQLLIDARRGTGYSKIPKWFIDTLTGSRGLRHSNAPDLAGLRPGSETRYGFVHLGGNPNRVGLIGPYGNSLYLDFDRKLVVALFASYPAPRSVPLLMTLERVWDALGNTSAMAQPPR